MTSTASAACSSVTSMSACSRVGPGAARGRRRVPSRPVCRRRCGPGTNASSCRCACDRAQPVVAGEPAAGLHPELRGGQVELVVDDDEPLRGDAVAADEARTASTRIVHPLVWGRRARPRRSPMRTSSARARSFPGGGGRRGDAASSSTTSAPTLWRVRAYSAPGLPSPTTSRSAGVPVPRRRRAPPPQHGLLPAALVGRVAGRGASPPSSAPSPFGGLALGGLGGLLLGDDAGRDDLSDERVGLDRRR